MLRPGRLAGAAAGALLAACAGSAPVRYPFRELKAGKHSNFTLVQGRAFRDDATFRRFSEGIRSLGTPCDFPAVLESVEWSREMVVVIFAGPSEESHRVEVLRVGEMAGSMVVLWKRTSGEPDRVFHEEPVELPKVAADYSATTPFLIAVVPRREGSVSFVRSQSLDEGF